jgi:FkbM family methyltransferase
MHLMQFIGLRRILPKRLRRALRGEWNQLLTVEQSYRERRFYRQFVSPNDLVFDVGANVGGKTVAFLSLGARVVAIEPNPNCVEGLRRRCDKAIRQGRLHLEALAVASMPGQVTLTAFASNHELSSGSREFLEYARAMDHGETREVVVPAITLDSLISQYGLPDFLKIDVEGMDAEVLSGLHRRPRAMSFEYHTAQALWKNTRDCFEHAKRLGFQEANLTAMANPRLILRQWVSLDQVLIHIQVVRDSGCHWGDVVVR